MSRYEDRTMQVKWLQCKNAKGKGTHWCKLGTLDLSTVTEHGVYIIWTEASPGSRVVRVGQGDVADRLSAHRNDRKILKYGADDLHVTWAVVPRKSRDGVERYLADTLSPFAP